MRAPFAAALGMKQVRVLSKTEGNIRESNAGINSTTYFDIETSNGGDTGHSIGADAEHHSPDRNTTMRECTIGIAMRKSSRNKIPKLIPTAVSVFGCVI
jgi:hypothetical protein